MIAVHIGLKKSGSSSIQSFLAANADALAGLGVDFPVVGRGPFSAHHNFAWQMMGRRKFIARRGGLEDLARAWRRRRAPVRLLSSEMFEGCDAAQVARLREALAGLGEPVRILLYIRGLASLISSSYAQKIKNGKNAHDFDTFFAERMAQPRIDFFRTAQNWASVFGWDAMRVRLLAPEGLVNGDLIDDLLTALDLDPIAPKVRTLARPGVINPAPGWRVLEAVRALSTDRDGLEPRHPLKRIGDRQPRAFGAAALRAGDALGWNADRGLYLTRGQALACHDAYRKAVARLNQVLSTALPSLELENASLPERPWMPDVDHIEPGPLRAFYDRMVEILSEHADDDGGRRR